MEQELFKNHSPEQKLEMLEANADSIEEMDYAVQLTQEELAESKTQFAQESIKEARLEDELKKIKDEYKEKLKPIKDDKKILLNEIKTGSRPEHGKVYKIVDQEEKMTGFYNNRGHLIYSRPMDKDERQLTIASSKRNAI